MNNCKISDKNFFKTDAVTLAKKLLGCFICRKLDEKVIRFKIVETEAYIGSMDSACHAYKGKTCSNRALFEQGGHVYVHICYGIHFMLNIVCGEKGDAQGVLIRGIEGASGPGNVAKKLFINKDLYLENLLTSDRLWIEDKQQSPNYTQTKRIGLGKVMQEDKDRLWRFVAKP